MSIDTRKLYGAIAVTRFGLGARPGEIAAASRDPQGWLTAQIRTDGAEQPVTAPFPTPLALRARLDGGPEPAARAAGTSLMNGPGAAAMGTSGAVQPPASLVTLVAGAPLPSMRSSYAPLSVYRQEIKSLNGDPAARRAAVTPILVAAGEEVLARTRLAALTSEGFRERWTLFWSNHFTVAAKGLAVAAAVGPFEREAIRPHVFGRFEELLISASSHPGMLLYLDQAQSIGPQQSSGRPPGREGGPQREPRTRDPGASHGRRRRGL